MEFGKILFISEKEAKALLSPEEAIALSEQAFAAYSGGRAINPVKLHMPLYPYHDGYINSMPAYLADQDIAGVKVVSVYRNNLRDHALPCTLGSIILNDPETGCPLAFLDGTYITAARTGATVAIFCKYLARKNSRVVTVIGTGAQGLSAALMTLTVLPDIREIRAVDIVPEARQRFVKAASARFPQVNFVEAEDMKAACRGADIVINAANSSQLLLPQVTLDPGATVLVLEEDLKPSYVKKTYDAFVTDFIDCFVERSNISLRHRHEAYGEEIELVTADLLSGEIGDAIIGKTQFRKSDDDIIVASSIGMGVQDVITAQYVYKKALEQGAGQTLQLLDL